LQEISHVFLSCQGDRDKLHESTPQAPRPAPIHCSTAHDVRPEPGEHLEIVVRPQLYPVVTLIWNDGSSQGTSSGASMPLRKERWLDLAQTCKKSVAQVDAPAERESISAWNLAADLIMNEIRAEEKRERNREAYESFGNCVARISSRTDLTEIRKAQMIHDHASALQLR
jgi:hypothetical protein